MKTIKETARTKVEFSKELNTLSFKDKRNNASGLIADERAKKIINDIKGNCITDGMIDLIAASVINNKAQIEG